MSRKFVVFYGLGLLLADIVTGAVLSAPIVQTVSTSTLTPPSGSSTTRLSMRRRMTPMVFQDFIDPTNRALSNGGAFDLESFTKNVAIRTNRNGQLMGMFGGNSLRNSLLARDMTSFDQDALTNNNNLNSLNNNNINDLSSTNKYGGDLLSSLDPYSALNSDFLLQHGGPLMSLSSATAEQRKLLYLFQLQQQRINQLSAWLEQCQISSRGSYGYNMGHDSGNGGGYGLPLAADMPGYGRSVVPYGSVGGYNNKYDLCSSCGNGGYGDNYGSGPNDYGVDRYGSDYGVSYNYDSGYGDSYGNRRYGFGPISGIGYGGNYGIGSGYGNGVTDLGYYNNNGIRAFGYGIGRSVLGYDSALRDK